MIFAAQTMTQFYGDQQQRAFGWFLPTIVPTLALMLSVFAADALRPVSFSKASVRRNFFSLSVGLSVFYLALVMLPIIGGIFFVEAQPSPQELVEARLRMLEESSIFIAPVQGLVVAALGVLFFLTEQDATPSETSGDALGAADRNVSPNELALRKPSAQQDPKPAKTKIARPRRKPPTNNDTGR